jgi:NAD(P)-dependent dehydrogenase (short-subunit alcohol dehydrogenase family)
MAQRILITGASAGLGRALALEHAAQGHRLLLLARRRDKLTAVARACRQAGAADVRVQAADVARRADLGKAVLSVQRAWGGLDVAYANAGYSQSGRLEALSLRQWRAQMAVNVEGVLHTLQACLPLLRASRGRVGVTSSVVSYGSLAGSGAYAASKAAVRALTQVLDLELQGSGVSVTHIAPGFFASEIRLKDADGRPDPDAPEYIPRLLLGDTAVLARRVRLAVAARRRELVWPLHAKLAVLLFRWLPGPSQALARRLSAYREHRKLAARSR